MSDIIKQTTDVHFIVAIHALTNPDITPLVAIATKNTDATTKSNNEMYISGLFNNI